jgi:site-specific DNA recombinase
LTRVCLYLRISTDEDHQPTSLKTQRERLERFCEAMEDWRIVAAFEDQASGTRLDRPGLQKALDLAREQRIDLLLVSASTGSPGRSVSSPSCARSWRSSTSC